PLFVRQSNGVIPTALAESLGGKIIPILRDIEALLEKSSFELRSKPERLKSAPVIMQ
ncbi:MAG: LysR family transcriptional regulator, partial [Psychrobium sp.]|nr:LysR family transcriptional regulator [Psychrobium sp.]